MTKKKDPKDLLKVGRPRNFSTPEEMQKAIDDYFDTKKKTTICGLALHLGFQTRKSLVDYEGYGPEFLTTIKIAKLRIEDYYEEYLTEAACTGSIFALKNFDWSDKREIETKRNEAEQVEIDEMKSELEELKNAGDGIATD